MRGEDKNMIIAGMSTSNTQIFKKPLRKLISSEKIKLNKPKLLLEKLIQ